MDEILSNLKVPPLFQRFSDEERQRMMSLCERREIPAGETIIEQGAASNGAYLMVKGAVALSRCNRQGHAFGLARLQGLEVFGEMELLDGGASMVSVKAVEDSLVLHLPVAKYRALLDDRDQLATKLLHVLSVIASQRLRDLDLQLIESIQEPGSFGPKAPTSTVVDATEDESSVEGRRDLFGDLLAGLFTARKPRP